MSNLRTGLVSCIHSAASNIHGVFVIFNAVRCSKFPTCHTQIETSRRWTFFVLSHQLASSHNLTWSCVGYKTRLSCSKYSCSGVSSSSSSYVNTCSFFHACFPHYLQASAVDVIAISSSSSSPDSDDKKLYEDDQNFDVVYDTDKILTERLRPLNAEHAAMCDMEFQTMCTHYLVKWAGYPTSNSTWTPATLCSKNLVEHYLQQKRQPRQEGLCLIPSREHPRFSYPIGMSVVSHFINSTLVQ